MKRIYLLLISLFTLLHVFSQSNTLNGKVMDADGKKPLSGASVTISGKVVATTDNDGSFSVPCEGSVTLTISYLGHETYTKYIDNCKEAIHITLPASTKNLTAVEITANSNKELIYQPVSIAKMGATELKRGWGLYLDDAINTNVPGVFMEKRAVSSGQQFNIRGYGNGTGFKGANNNFDGQGSKVYLNGIPITDAEGITTLDDIDFSTVGNVEVTKGPAGSLYGLAIAGVVNLETIKPKPGETSIGQDLMFGSYGLQNYTTRFSMGTKKGSVLATYGHQKSNGYMDSHTASHKDFVNVIGEFRPDEKQTVGGYFGYSNSYDQRAGELTIGQYDTLDYSGNPRYIKNDAHSALTSFRGGVNYKYAINKHFSHTTTVFGTGVFNTSSSAAGWTDKNSVNFGLRSTVNVDYDFKKGFGLSAIVGTELQQQLAQTIGYTMVADSANLPGYNKIGTMKSNAFAKEGTWSFISEITLRMPFDFDLTFGAGVSSMKINIDDRFYSSTSTNPTSYGASYKNLFSPKVALNKVFNKQYSVYFAYTRGYKAPVSSNIFIAATGDINTGLKAEMGDQLELGTKGSVLNNRINYSVAVYDAMFKNKMTTVAVPLDSTTTAYTYTANGGGQTDIGVEASIKAVAYESPKGYVTVSPFANISYSYFRYKDFHWEALNSSKTDKVITDYSGKPVGGVSPIVANVGIDVNSPKYGPYFNMTYSYRDAMPITSDGANMTNPYHLLNMKIGYEHIFFKHLKVNAYFGVNNVTSSQYYYMVFVNQMPDAYLPAPRKANFYGGLGLTGIF